MGHKADGRFFKTKREWSKYKDQILAYYLTPYLPKIATQRRSTLIVDGFAGPGEFDDQEPGSPLIIAKAVEQWRRWRGASDVSCLFVERDAGLFARLQHRMADFNFVECRNANFIDVVPEIQARAKAENVFLYLDPFTVEGLRWRALESIFDALKSGISIEVLLNFNVDSFCRRALAALKRASPQHQDDLPDADCEPSSNPTVAELSDILGSSDWIRVLNDPRTYEEQVAHVTKDFLDRLRMKFNEVCAYEVRERWQHKVPKYVLVFGSRHPHALRLMNDAMRKARESFLAEDLEASDMLFECRPEHLVPSTQRLSATVIDCATTRMPRHALVDRVIRAAFCFYSTSQIRKEISEQIKLGRLRSSTGKHRINDDVEVWKAPSLTGSG